MRSIAIAALGVTWISSGSALAQTIDDDRVCAELLRTPQTGLFVAYAEGGQAVLRRAGGQNLPYSRNTRLFFVPPGQGGNGRSEEGVWHIRAQTRASAAPGATHAYVYRPPVTTRCSRGRPLPAFSADDRFVELNRYIDHHAPNSRREPDRGLKNFFHFPIQEAQGQCIETDNREAFGNLEEHYGFRDGDARSDRIAGLFERATSVAPSARAATSRYAGLSSEFTYQEAAPSCFGFSAPLPTGVGGRWVGGSKHQRSMAIAEQWKPVDSLIVIKRLRGRTVVEAIRHTISWTP